MAAILRMTKRSRNGPRCRKYHLVPWSDGIAGRAALCGARPNIGSVGARGVSGAQGWGERAGKHVTCSACHLARAEAA